MDEDDELAQLESLLNADLNEEQYPEGLSSRCVTGEANIFLKTSNIEEENLVSEKNSLLHTGDTDSSEDEERRNCLEPTLDSYGTSIKRLLDEKDAEKIDSKLEFQIRLREANREIKSPKFKSDVTNTFLEKPNLLCAPEVKKDNKSFNVYACPGFGINIVKPLISSATFMERMNGREAINMMRVKRHVECGDLSKDWVLAGVIVRKSSTKESQKGSKFTIWTLSDLKDDLKSVTLFLFKKAYSELWKLEVGTVVAVLNPGVLDKKNDNGIQASLSVDTPDKVMTLGQSKDFGVCRSTKKNREPCSSFINKSQGDHCIFHVKQEYQKFSKRQELQSMTMGKGLVDLRNKVLGKDTVIYGGRAFTAIPSKSKKVVEQDKNRLMSLSDYYKTETDKLMINQAPYGSSPVPKSINNPVLNQKFKDKGLLDKLYSTPSMSSVPNGNIISSKLGASSSRLGLTGSPKIGLGLVGKGTIDLSISYNQRSAERSKLKAIQLIEKAGGLKKANPHNIRGTESGKKRAIEKLNNSSDSENECKKVKVTESDPFITKNGIKSDRFKKILEATSAHQSLIVQHDDEEQDKYFNKLEKKEAMEEKMLNTFKLQCKGVRCTKCKYTSFSAADRCKEEGHPLKVFDTFKRFFKCSDCGNRTITLDIIPLHACKNCNSSRWEKAPMIREKKNVTLAEGLSLRGEEESFIGAQVTGGNNINLLVPEGD